MDFCGRRDDQAVASPRKVTRRSGIPKRVSVIRSPVASRALRASRSSHDKRECARWAREIVGGETIGGGGRAGSIWMSRRWRCRWIHACLWCRRCQSRQSSGAVPTTRGWSRMLTWRGLVVALPLHWHCSRKGHRRQSRMLAPYTTRRLPSVSRRCSCGRSALPTGQRSVPSDWRGKSAPVKRPAFQDIAVAGGAYPEAGGEARGVGSFCDGRAGANSVVRTGSGASVCPNSRRTFQVP